MHSGSDTQIAPLETASSQLRDQWGKISNVDILKQKLYVVAFNGPPRSGKDTAVDYFQELSRRAKGVPGKQMVHAGSLARLLKEKTHQFFGLDGLPYNYFENVKDEPRPEFMGNTPRSVYIATGEKFTKPLLGQDFWARQLVKNLLMKYQHDKPEDLVPIVLFISDLGFREEIEFLLNFIGPEQILLVHLRRDGCDFSNDSRRYVNHRKVEYSHCSVYNNSTLEAFYSSLEKNVGQWLTDRNIRFF